MIAHIFNPETDYALAIDHLQYTPPKQIVALRRQLAAIPALWAREGEVILMPDKPVPSPYLDLAVKRGIEIISIDKARGYEVRPWGWNKAIAHALRKSGAEGIPDNNRLTTIRQLAHRRNTRLFHVGEDCPEELRSVRCVEEWLSRTSDCYLKAPWSSSGRGVIHSTSMSREAILKWCGGIINRQGSVMAEKGWNRTLDFATEWECRGGEAIFNGFSIFKTSDEGRYLGNISASETTLLNLIQSEADWNDDILLHQKRVLDTHFAPFYTGPIGIDMLADCNRRVNICVEVNVRQTMGMAAAALFTLTRHEQLWHPLKADLELF